MKVLVVGASGATGSKLVEQLLNQKHKVKVIVRSPKKLPGSWKTNKGLQITTASVLQLSDNEMCEIVKDCDAVASCLGHNLTFKGINGQPTKIVTDATKRLYKAIKSLQPKKPIKFLQNAKLKNIWVCNKE